jgi:glycolate oxidase iron-sulfur subunit
LTEVMPIEQFAGRAAKLQACIHCGLCLEHCPTYLVTGEEMSNPRGRIYLMKALEEERIEPVNIAFIAHEESCVVCRSCETACPSGVQFGILMEQTREIINDKEKPNWLRRFVYTKLLGSPKLIRALQYPLAFLSRSRIGKLFSETFNLKNFPFPRVAASLALLPDDIHFPNKRPLVYPAHGKRRGSVGILIGCIGDLFTSHINDASIKVLTSLGYDVYTIPEITCCGALASHAGFGNRARELALNAITILESSPIDYYITNIAGCGAMMKDYYKHFEGTEDYGRAIELKKKMRDISEFLLEFHSDELINLDLALPEKTVIGYQAPCHLYHGQQIVDDPLRLIKFIKNVETFAFEENNICCGSAGTYNIEHPAMGEALLARKMSIIEKHDPDIIATANAGCLTQLKKGVRQTNIDSEVQHVIEIIASAM